MTTTMIRSLISLLFCAVATVGAATWYVSPSGNDSAAGTISAPWLTYTNALYRMAAGDTVYFRSGTYQEHGYPVPGPGHVSSYNPKNNQSFLGYPGETAIIECADTTKQTTAFYLAGVTNVRVADLTVRGTDAFATSGQRSYAFRFMSNVFDVPSMWNTVSNCTVTNFPYIVFSIQTGNPFQLMCYNTLWDWALSAKTITGAPLALYASSSSNQFTHNRCLNSKFWQTYAPDDCGPAGVQLTGADVIGKGQRCDANIVSHNYFSNVTYGVKITQFDTTNNLVYNNIIDNFYNGGITFDHYANKSIVANNTIKSTWTNASTTTCGALRFYGGTASFTNNVAVNNICWVTTSMPQSILFYFATDVGNTISNTWFIGRSNVYKVSTGEIPRYNSVYGTNVAMIGGSPFYGTEYGLIVNDAGPSDGIDVGVEPFSDDGQSLVTDDYGNQGRPFNLLWDIGAWEYWSPVSPPASGTVTANRANVRVMKVP